MLTFQYGNQEYNEILDTIMFEALVCRKRFDEISNYLKNRGRIRIRDINSFVHL